MRSRTGTWFTTKVKYQKTQEDGTEKVVSETYVVDALSFTEAESSIIDEMSVYVSGEFHVSGITKSAFGEIFFSDVDDDDKWYRAKLQFITIDDKSDKEKRTNVVYLVQAKSLARALRYIDEVMGKTMIDYDTIGINETPIMDVFEHQAASEKKEEKNDVPEYEQENKKMEYDVKGNLREVLGLLPEGVRLVAISKFHPNEYIEAAYEEGQRVFGESHEQELARKVESLPKDIEWHFIGHLQTNKVKYIAPYIAMIEAVDSLKLLKEINKQAAKHDRVIKVLLELHIAAEETKYGLTLDACRQLLEEGEWKEMKNVQICGLMMMASHVDDQHQIASEFDTAARFFDEVKAKYFADCPAFCERSWGMSHDYQLAVQHGSTMVRVGTTIFGPRVY